MSSATERAAEIARNLEAVRERIGRAVKAAGRAAGSTALVAVSKTMPAADIAAAMAAGQEDFGENYAQELRDKRPELDAASSGPPPNRPLWHFIGPLQSNKIKYLAGKVELIHTVDSPALLQEIARRVQAGTDSRAVQDCLVQVNVAEEPQKRGVTPAALPALLDEFARLERVRCLGLMLIPPFGDDPEASRPHFRSLRQLFEQLGAVARPNVLFEELSMGMSHDLEVAIAEGATMVRVGTAIFGERRRAT